ncbi:MAG: Crp/Fnr family transcriptional regulator [Burkholderiales bacterium]|nr:Crp/Fnr family transcriptional regulator [Burkholderiales bacterium]MCA3157925.1 Crp/Fnr family transcriptional regulator [Burkholderiales bacterium]MCA3168800.1 Crp/Fnr family transcriptional regulator [Burkholderiales bacterium]
MYLRTVELLSGLSDPQLDALLHGSRSRVYPKGSVVVNEGDPSHALFIVKSGSLKVYLNDEEGKEVVLSTLEPGEYFGELGLIDDAPRSASVVALENSDLLQVPKDAFQQLLEQYPDALHIVTRNLVGQVRRLTDSVRTLALLDVFGRIVRLLTSLGVEDNDGRLVISPKLTQKDIASRVGSSREMVSRIFKDLVIGGYLTFDSDSITVNKKLPAKW